MAQLSKIFTALTVGLVFTLTGLMSQVEAKTFYAGKTIQVLCQAPAGGGLSRTGSVFIKHMRKHIDGNPNIIMKNMPGGGGLKAANYMADKAKPDGLTIGWGIISFSALALDFPGVRYDTDDFDYIGSGSLTFASLIRKDFPPGMNSAADIVKAKNFRIGGQGPTSGLDMFSRLPLNLLGVKYKYIPGYKGQPQMNAAIRSKEINFLSTGDIGFHVFYANTILKDGTAIPLYYHSPLDDNNQPIRSENYPAGMQNYLDFVSDTLGRKLSGPEFEAYVWLCNYQTPSLSMMGPKGIDKNLLDQLRRAHAATVADPAFKADYVKQFNTWPIWGPGERLEKMAQTYDQMSPEAFAVLKKMTSRK